MPVTPLNFGILAVINHFARNKVSNISFIIVSLWIDGNTILYPLFGLTVPQRDTGSSVFGAAMLALIVAIFGFKSRKWMYGAFAGGLSHVITGTLVHAVVKPFFPQADNLLFMDQPDPVSLLLFSPCLWLAFQYICYDWEFLVKQWSVGHPHPKLPPAQDQ